MKRIFLWSIIPLGLLLLLLSTLASTLLLEKAPPQAVTITVKPGSSLTRVAHQLEQSEVIHSALTLKLMARWTSQAHSIQAGSYRFEHPATAVEIFDRLIRGDVEKVSLTIPEGFNLQQIIERISQLGYGRKAELTALAHDPDFISSLNISASSLEGYLFPETYHFAPGHDERALLKMLVEQLQLNLTDELKAAAKNVGFSIHQLVTLASIIEKETAVVEEMPLISAVFHNRLKRQIPLQTDPTVIYGIENFDGNITRKHLTTPTPYNTYTTRGLPPGPIASPGLAALRAAAAPAQTQYLYFVSRGDGSHQFSKTLKDHNAAVYKYQLKRKR